MPGPGFPLIRPISPPPTGTGTQSSIDTTAPWLSEKVDAALAERFQQRLCLKHIGCPAERNGANKTPPAQPHSEHTSQKPDWHRAFAPDEATTLTAEP